MINKINFIITSKTEYDLSGYVKETGYKVNVPKCTVNGFDFFDSCRDEDGYPRLGIELPAVQKDNGTVYLDRASKRLWIYSAQNACSPDNEWLPVIRQLLSLNKIDKLSKETCDELLELYSKRRFSEMRRRIIEECGLYSFIFDEESQLHENKSSLVYPANKHDFNTFEEQRTEQFNELSRTIVGALNAGKKENFHLIVGISDDGVPNDNVRNEIRDYYNNNTKTFTDMFVNRLKQLTTCPDCLTSIEFNFIDVGDKLVLDIVIPQWTGDIILFRKDAYLRVQSTTQKLQAQGLIELLNNRNKINNI